MTGPLFSVVIPTYDRPAFLRLAVESVLRQTVRDLECLVVDDASPAPVRVVSDPRVRVVRNSANLGEPGARNRGLREARGRYLAFLDDDDEFTPDRLEMALEGLTSAPIALCWRGATGRAEEGNRSLNGQVYDVILDGLTPQLGQVALERSIAPEFDERFAAVCDVEWLLRLVQHHAVRTVPRVGLVYRLHSGVRHGNGVEARVRGSRLLLNKHARYFQEHPRAAAFRWKRIGLLAHQLGDHALARAAFTRSLWLRPEVRAAWHLARSMRPSRTSGREHLLVSDG